MHRQNLLNKLKLYKPQDARDASKQRATIEFVNSYPNCFERTLEIGHITGSAWLVDPSGRETLLTHHRKLRCWIQPGGHADGNSDVLEVAYREAIEETGIQEIRPVSENIFDIDIHPIPARQNEPAHLHYDIRFAFEAYGLREFHATSESLELAWVAIDKLETFTKEESMLRMKQKWFCSITF